MSSAPHQVTWPTGWPIWDYSTWEGASSIFKHLRNSPECLGDDLDPSWLWDAMHFKEATIPVFHLMMGGQVKGPQGPAGGPRTLRARWGSWSWVLMAFSLWTNGTVSEKKTYHHIQNRPSPENKAEHKHAKIPIISQRKIKGKMRIQ